MLNYHVRRPARPLKLHPGWIRAGNALGQAAVLFLFTRARLFGELTPLAPACFSAALTCGRPAVPMLLGCALGVLTFGCTPLDFMPLTACLIVWCLHAAFSLHRKRRTAHSKEKKPSLPPCLPGGADFFSGMAAGTGILLAGMAASGGIAYNLLTAALNAAVSALIAPAMRSALGIRPSRRILLPEEQLSLALIIALLTAGLRALPFFGRGTAQAAAVWLTLIASSAGCGTGALAGLTLGAAMSLTGEGPFTGSTLGLCGVLAGCMKEKHPLFACAAFASGSLFTVSAGVGFSLGALELFPLIAGCVLRCLTPRPVLSRLTGWMTPAKPHADPDRMAARVRRKAAHRLSGLSEVMGELADGYEAENLLPSEQEIIMEARNRLCSGCTGYAACWQGTSPQAGRLICRMAAEALRRGSVTHIRDLPPDIVRHCRKSGQIDQKLLPWLEELAVRRRQAVRRGEARGLMARQFRETQRILNGLATQLEGGVCVSGDYAQLSRAALDKAGLTAQEVIAVLDDRLEISCVLKNGMWDEKAARRAAAYIGDELGLPMSPALRSGRVPGECELNIVQAPGLTASFAEAGLSAKDGEVSGDTSCIRMLADGRLIALLSDGMGSGEAAARESRRCISLLRKFISAGVGRETALSAVNSLLVLREGDEMFATADVCAVNLYTGEAEFSKLGACRSFILNQRGVRRIEGGRLPMGILDQVEPETRTVQLQPGDMIVMISDGMADELKPGQMEAFERELMLVRRLPPAQAAQRLLSFAQARDAGQERDDMTVLAVRILARRVSRAE